MKKTDTHEILEAIQGLGQRIDGVEHSLGQRIDGVEHSLGQRIDGVDQKLSAGFDAVEKRVGDLEERVGEVEQNLTEQIGLMAEEVHDMDGRLKKVESLMVTKDYLDRKYSNWRDETIMHVKRRVSCWKEIGTRKTA